MPLLLFKPLKKRKTFGCSGLKFWPNIFVIKAWYHTRGQFCKFVLSCKNVCRIGPGNCWVFNCLNVLIPISKVLSDQLVPVFFVAYKSGLVLQWVKKIQSLFHYQSWPWLIFWRAVFCCLKTDKILNKVLHGCFLKCIEKFFCGVCICVCACVPACVRACVCVCVCACECVHVCVK